MKMASEHLTARLLSGGAWMTAARIGSGLVGITSYAIISRMAPPSDVGTYFLAVSMVSLGNILVSFGAKDAIVRVISENLARGDEPAARAFIFSALRVGVFGAALSASVYACFAHLLFRHIFRNAALEASALVMALWIAFSGLQSLLADIFRGLQMHRLAAIFTGNPGLASGVLLFPMLMVMRGAALTASFAALAACNVVALCLGLLWALTALLRRTSGLRAAPAPLSATRRLLAISWPMLVSSVLLYAISQADLWCVGRFLGREQVALYGAAWRLSQLVAIPVSLANAILPSFIAELHAARRLRQLEDLLRASATLGGMAAGLACLLLVIGAPRILAFVYGSFYSAAAVPLALLSAGSAANVLAGSSGFTLLMTGNEKALMALTLTVGVLFAAGERLAVPRAGMVGAAAVASAAMVLQNLLMVAWVRRTLGIWTHFSLCVPGPPAAEVSVHE
jgi:O-antigen/teichoic acid export membrane protein